MYQALRSWQERSPCVVCESRHGPQNDPACRERIVRVTRCRGDSMKLTRKHRGARSRHGSRRDCRFSGKRLLAGAGGRLRQLACSWARALADGGLDLLAPPACLACGLRLPSPRLFSREDFHDLAEIFSLCRDCARLLVLAGPSCSRCGGMLPSASRALGSAGAAGGWAANCWSCQQDPPAQDSVSCVMAYEGVGRELLLAYKKSRAEVFLSCMVGLLSLRGALITDFPVTGTRPAEEPAVVCGIPRHPVERLLRGGPGGDLLAAAFASRQGLVFRRLLRKRRWTPRQAGLGRRQRLRNLRGVFAARRIRRFPSRVLLVDDVLTTGSTVKECAAILKSAGVERVDVLTVARSPEW